MEIEAVALESPDIKTIRLRWPSDYQVEFKTGQFITLFWPDTPNYRRAYSLSSCALDQGYFEVTVKREGSLSGRIVDSAKPGDILGVYPPTGRFLPVFEPGKHLVCIAGGIGVAPYRGFIREATRRKLNTRITLLYSVRHHEDAIFHEEFRQHQERNRHFNLHITCTRLPEEHPWAGRRGRINAEWIKEHARDLSNTIFYACGSTALVADTELMLQQQLGASKEQIKMEKWG
jgi:toluene monooxygenase electron transfer component